MPDDPVISYDELKKILDETGSRYHSLTSLGMDAQNAGMAEYLSGNPAFDGCGMERGVAWGHVKNGGIIIFDNITRFGNSSPPVTGITVPPVPGDTPPAAGTDVKTKIAALSSEMQSLVKAVTLPEKEWKEKSRHTVSVFRSIVDDLPGTGAEKEERKKKIDNLLVLLESGDGGIDSRSRQIAALTSAFSDTMKLLAGPMAPPGGATPGAPATGTPVHHGIPGSKRVQLMTSFPSTGYFGNVTQYLRKYGYEVYEVDNAGINEYKSIPECGVLVVSAHGTYLHNVPFREEKAGTILSIYTNTLVEGDGYTDPYSRLWVRGRLVIYKEDYTPFYDNWAFTNYFVKDYWKGKLAKNSFVYMDTCHSMGPFSGPMREAIHAAGASVIAGWTLRSLSGTGPETAAYLFDRMLGANQFEGESPVVVQKEEVLTGMKQRPFDWKALEEDMAVKKLGTAFDSVYTNLYTPPKPTELKFDANGDGDADFGLLRPSIRYIEVDESRSLLTLFGIFGKRRDKNEQVTVDGQPVEIGEWRDPVPYLDDKIVCKNMPFSGNGSEGDVMLTVNGTESNRVPLTGWHGKFTYTVGKEADNVCQTVATLTFPVFLRGDIHRVRKKPGRLPEPRRTQASLVEDPASPLESSMGGSCTIGDNYYEWKGSGTVPPGGSPMGGFCVYVPYEAVSGPSNPQLIVAVLSGWGRMTLKHKGKTVYSDSEFSVYVGPESGDPDDLEMLRSEAIWDPTSDNPLMFSIPGKTRTWDLTFVPVNNPKLFKGLLTWEEMEPRYPPDKNTEA